jgi:hypothetical protein
MDGMDSTYERLRGRTFGRFLKALTIVRATGRFGINFLVNDDTIGDLPRAADFALENGAEEFLLLPEVPLHGRKAPRRETMQILESWIVANWSIYPLRTSSMYAGGLSLPVAHSSDGREFMDFLHVDASGVLKGCAFDKHGVQLADRASLLDSVSGLSARSDITNLVGEEL